MLLGYDFLKDSQKKVNNIGIDEDEKEGITDDDWLDLDKSLSEQKEKIKGKKEKVQKKVSGTKSEIQKLEEAIVALTKEIKE